MSSHRILILLLGSLCFPAKESFCVPLHEQEVANTDGLDDWLSEYTSRRAYRDDKKKEEVPDDEEEGEEEEEEEEVEEEEGEGGDDGGGATKEGDGKDLKKGSEGGAAASKGASSAPAGSNLNADVAGDKAPAEKKKEEGDEEDEEEEEDEDEEDEGDEVGEEGDDDEEDGEEDEDGEADDKKVKEDKGVVDDDEEDEEEDPEEIDKSELLNVAAGGAKVSYEEVTATKYAPHSTKSSSGVEVSEGGLAEEAAHFPDQVPENVRRLMQNYQSWAADQPAAAATAPSEPRNPYATAAPAAGRPASPDASPAASSSPIILPIVFVPFDMDTNRVNLPAQMQSHQPPLGAQRRPPPATGRPPPGYGLPPPGYGRPPPGYGRPPPGYGQPAPDSQDLQLIVVPVEQ